jgi:hypothetical protein
MNRKARLIIGSITALLMLAGIQVVLAAHTTDILFGIRDENHDPIVAGDAFIAIDVDGSFYIVEGPQADANLAYYESESVADNFLACLSLNEGWEVYDHWYSESGGSVAYEEALDATCFSPDPPVSYGGDVILYVQEQPTAWSLGVEGAFTTTQMQQFFSPDPVGEGGSDFIPNSGEWLTNITDYALSWLQTINQDDFLFFLMAFGLVNYIISWLWKQLSGASVMGEAQAWRGMFDDGEE